MTTIAPTTLTQVQLKIKLKFNPENGEFYWRRNGKLAGHMNSRGYIQLVLNNKLHLAHRLVWLYVNGTWPREQIDHINQHKYDNRIENLRDVTQSQNLINQPIRMNNVSGHKGVSWHKQLNKWQAEIRRNNTSHYLGIFTHLVDAIAARQEAEKLYDN